VTGVRRRPGGQAALAALAALAGCGVSIEDDRPSCRTMQTLVLAAQAVPAADRVPCVALLPAGWGVSEVTIRRGLMRFALDSDRAGDRAVVVRLEPSCDTGGATEIRSDEAGTRRLERIDSVTEGLRATRYYLHAGGCTTYTFRFAAAGRALLNEVSLALTFATRAQIAVELQRTSDGRRTL
jgi:hypothetical protein